MVKKKKTLEEKLEEAIVKDVPYEVPDNWVWINMKEVLLELETGKRPKGGVAGVESGIPSLGGEHLSYSGGFNLEKIKFVPEEFADSLVKGKICKDDILIVKDGATTGKTSYVDENFPFKKAVINEHVFKCVVKKEFIPKYIFWFVVSPIGQKFIKENLKGSAQGGINTKFIENFPMSISPLKEQERIVNRIESLFEKLDNSKELIEEAREGFEKRKSAILEKAFRGELTKKWREENISDKDYLLKKLLVLNKNIKKNFSFSDSSKLYKIPNEWKWIKLKDICEKFKYGTSSKSIESGKIPVLRMGNLQSGKLDWTNLVYTNDDNEIEKYELKKGDLLFNRTNSPELVGKTSIYESEKKAIYAGYLIRIRVLDGIEPKFTNYFMNSIYAKARCMEVKSDGVSQSNINAEKLGEFDIPLPSSNEQKEIVKVLDNILEIEEKSYKFAKLEEEIELIKKSILAKAFRGELGTNCKDDESALELLKEILNKE